MAACHRWPTSGRRGRFRDGPGSWVICSVRAGVHRGAARGPARGRALGLSRPDVHPPLRLGHGPVPGPQGAPRRRAEFEDAVETHDPEGSEGLPLGAPEDEPDAGRRRLAAKVEQEPGRPGAEERRAAQVEHERGVAAKQRDELGLELASATSRSPSSGTTMVRSAGARRLGRRLGRVVRRGAGAVVIRKSVSAAAAAAPAAGRPPPVRRRREETTIGPAPRTGTRSPEPAAGSSSPTTLWIPAPRTLPAHMTAGQQGVRPLINGRPGREGAGEAPGISRKRPIWTGSAATCAPTPTGYPRPVR